MIKMMFGFNIKIVHVSWLVFSFGSFDLAVCKKMATRHGIYIVHHALVHDMIGLLKTRTYLGRQSNFQQTRFIEPTCEDQNACGICNPPQWGHPDGHALKTWARVSKNQLQQTPMGNISAHSSEAPFIGTLATFS